MLSLNLYAVLLGGRTKDKLCVESHQQHSDDHLIVDDLIIVDKIGPYTIHLKPTTQLCHLEINSFYRKLSLPEILERAAALNNKEFGKIQ